MAGIFGLFDFTKEGPGVDKNAPPLKGLPLFFSIYYNGFWKLVKLNLLFLLFCLPIVTIPAAISGMTRVLRDFVEEKPVYIWTDFWSSFKSNFVQSSLYGAIVLLVGALMYFSIAFYFNSAQGNFLIYIGGSIVLAMALLLVFMSFFVHLMIVSVDLKLSVIVNNAFRLSVICFFRNLLTLLVVAVLALAMVLFFPITAILLLLISFSTIGFIICFRSFPILKKYVITETKREAAEYIEPIFKD